MKIGDKRKLWWGKAMEKIKIYRIVAVILAAIVIAKEVYI